MRWKENLIKLYFYMCEDRDIQGHLGGLRMSNNYVPEFTDEEVLTVYIFGTMQKQNGVRAIYDFTKDYLSCWFPLLPTYQAFNRRLNNLFVCFEVLVDSINAKALQEVESQNEKVIDSFPIILTGKSRSSSAKVAPHLCDKGYCASKELYYYGLKLHVQGLIRAEKMPMPQTSWISGASQSDLTVARPLLEKTYNSKLYADKIYKDKDLISIMETHQNSSMLIPVKKNLVRKVKMQPMTYTLI